MSTLLLPSPPTADQTDKVAEFCQAVISRHSEKWPVPETTLADEFLDFCDLHSLLTIGEMTQVCRDRFGIPVSFAPLPTGMKGCNGSYHDRREISISLDQDLSIADLHTLLHELREIFEVAFEKMGHPIANREKADLEACAEAFAVSAQICAALKVLPDLLDNVSEIERRWKRIGAYVLLSAGALFYAVSCAILPLLEDAFAAQRLQRVQRSLKGEMTFG